MSSAFNMRSVHRTLAASVGLFVLYLAVTGTLIQLLDFRTLLSGAPATDPNLRAIRESLDGPPNYQVISDADYSAEALPPALHLEGELIAAIKAARVRDAGAPVRYVEARVLEHRPVTIVRLPGSLLVNDADTGEEIPALSSTNIDPLPPQSQTVPSLRSELKGLHRLTSFSDNVVWINVVVGFALLVLVVSGLVVYFRLLATRMRLGRNSPLWFAGDTWRNLHRCVAILATVFILVPIGSGLLLAIDSLGHSIYMRHHKAPVAGVPSPRFPDVSSPLSEAEVPMMLATSLRAFQRSHPGAAIKVIRLRYFADMPQGVIVTGGEKTQQIVFNAATGVTASLSEPGYPPTGQPFGWRIHQLLKQVHRGDWLGMTGRSMDLVAGISLIFLSTSGLVMYVGQWKRRRRSGRSGPFWA